MNKVTRRGDLALVANDHDGLRLFNVAGCRPGATGGVKELGRLPVPKKPKKKKK